MAFVRKKIFITDPISKRKVEINDLSIAIEESEILMTKNGDDKWTAIFGNVLDQLYTIWDEQEIGDREI